MAGKSKSGPIFKMKAGRGGQTDELVMIGVAGGGAANEVREPPKNEAIKTNLDDMEFDMEGADGHAQIKKMKMIALLEGGVGHKLQETRADTEIKKRYRMDADPRGWCYIFNNKEFDGTTENRMGSDEDRDNIAKIFRDQLKFQVNIFNNKPSDVIEDELEKLSKLDHTSLDCVVVIFLTHGKEGAIKGSDNDWLTIKTITSYFKPDKCHPKLIEKPKLFFFQSCRGKQFQKGHVVKGDGSGDEDDREYREMEKLVAPESHFFIGYSTVSGMKAVRNVEMGSWYIQELAAVLKDRADRDDLAGLMTEVNNRVQKRKSEATDGTYIKQTTEYSSTLDKKLYFLPQLS